MSRNSMEDLSKTVSYALRHAPWEYELEMDAEGWVLVAQLVEALQRECCWQSLSAIDLREMIAASPKPRHELREGKIRAFYGHSLPMKIEKMPQKPLEFLYHGTARRFWCDILKKGLQPQSRQYVHLSQDRTTAEMVGKRRDARPILLKVRALEAWENDVQFYYGNKKVWLADAVPASYFDREED